jgi:UDP-N-acetylglucosamine 2-epimerase (non-hydrolysing)/GDP/UDP-N,N'-diacetylbacillosamine 2-epimerase (hydrolysing)
MIRKIAVITGSRAEYGLLYWIIKGIHEDPELELQLIATGMHLSPEFGFTVAQIEADNFPLADCVEMLLSSDTRAGTATSMGLGVIGFSKTYSRLAPDIILVLGDRFEIFSAVAAAVPFGIPVAHIHGGETTEGAIDELYRHAITKMSHIHFPAALPYADRLIRMGEDASHVFCCGAPGLDNLFRLRLMSKEKILEELGLPSDKQFGVVTYHPVTLQGDSRKELGELLAALSEFSNIFWICTASNADAEGRAVNRQLDEYVAGHASSAKKFTSLGQIRYLSLLKHASIMLGNSSSGVIEAPSLRLPVINIGDRQKGRILAKNIINIGSPVAREDISAAIRMCLNSSYKKSLENIPNPYGTGDTCDKILTVLKRVDLGSLRRKRFCDNA